VRYNFLSLPVDEVLLSFFLPFLEGPEDACLTISFVPPLDTL